MVVVVTAASFFELGTAPVLCTLRHAHELVNSTTIAMKTWWFVPRQRLEAYKQSELQLFE